MKRDIDATVPAIVFIPPLRRVLPRLRPLGALHPRPARPRRPPLRRDRVSPRERKVRGGYPLAHPRGPVRRRQRDDGRRNPRPAHHPPCRRPRDDGHRARLGALLDAPRTVTRRPSSAPNSPRSVPIPSRTRSPTCRSSRRRARRRCGSTRSSRTSRRRLRAPMTLGRYTLPAGAGIAATVSRMHANPRLYPNPTAFDAKRFLGNKPPMFGYAPFGGGSRRCLGAAFATYEMKLVLATLPHDLRARARQPERRPLPA